MPENSCGMPTTPMPWRTGWRPVRMAARVGVHDGSVYMRVKLIPSAAMRLMFGRLVAEVLLQRGEADGAEGGVVPQQVDDVGRRAVLLAQLGQLLASSCCVLGRPAFAVLRFQDVELRVRARFSPAPALGRRSPRQDQGQGPCACVHCLTPFGGRPCRRDLGRIRQTVERQERALSSHGLDGGAQG